MVGMDYKLLIKRFLSIRSSYGAKIGADGCIYYISDITSIPSIWRACKEGGGWRSDLWLPWDRRVGSIEISIDGYLAFSTDKYGDEKWAIYTLSPDGTLSRVAGDDGSMNLLGLWDPSGRLLAFTSNLRNGVDFDLYVYDRISGATRLVAELTGINIAAEWIDPERILVVHRETNLDSDIYLVNISRGSTTNLTRHQGEALNISPRRLDKNKILYLSNLDDEYLSIRIKDVEGGSERVVYREDWDIEAIQLVDGNAIFSVNYDGESILKKALIMDDSISKPKIIEGIPRGTISSLDANRRGMIVASVSSPKIGIEVFAGSIDKNTMLERVTYSPKAWISEERLVEPSKFEYESFDGLKIRGLVYSPPDESEKSHPAVVYLHGGPESQERFRFNFFPQALANLGIATVAPNFRGSSGYGKTFVHLDDIDKRLDAVRDVYHAVKHLADRGFIDESRVCVMGGSYGGYLTLMSLAIYPDIWRCGVEIVGIVNLVTFIKNTSPYRRKYRMAEYGDPDKHGDVMLRLSPISYIDRIRAPLMVIHGAKDPRVPVSEAEQLVDALRSRGIEVKYVRLEDEGHGISNVNNRVRVYSEALEFIASHIVSPS
ncbi:MAG: S9 family peptidase [Aeropyrum sp.]|nr:S9 family peptidase [Aeropyrum sp.]